MSRVDTPLILVALLVAGNLLVLARDTLHEGVELEVVRLGDGFWLLCEDVQGQEYEISEERRCMTDRVKDCAPSA